MGGAGFEGIRFTRGAYYITWSTPWQARFLVPPCSPFNFTGEDNGLIFEPVSVYQKYTGMGFFVVLCLGKEHYFRMNDNFDTGEISALLKLANLRDARAPRIQKRREAIFISWSFYFAKIPVKHGNNGGAHTAYSI